MEEMKISTGEVWSYTPSGPNASVLVDFLRSFVDYNYTYLWLSVIIVLLD